MTLIYDTLKTRMRALCGNAGISDGIVAVKAKTLTTEEAIGNPEADDFPLQKGRERLMQALFKGGVGQAFTDRFGDFEGTLEEVFEMPLVNNYRRAVFVSTLNAVLHHLGKIRATVHCRDNEPAQCAGRLVPYLLERYGKVKIAQVGFQPRMVEALSEEFPMRLLDLDPANIGICKFNVLVEGPDAEEDVTAWADLLLVTGSTLANGTVERFLNKKPILFYGNTIAGAAFLMNWDRFCACGH